MSSEIVYSIPFPIIRGYGDLVSCPWTAWWSRWKIKWPHLGILYILSNHCWSSRFPNSIKFGVSDTILPARLNSYNGTNIENCIVEFMCLCTEPDILETDLKDVFAPMRIKNIKVRNGRSEWITNSKFPVIQECMKRVTLNTSVLEELGVPIFEYDPDKMNMEINGLNNIDFKVLSNQCPVPYDPTNTSIFLSTQEQMYVALFQTAWLWSPMIRVELIHVAAKLSVPPTILKGHMEEVSLKLHALKESKGLANDLIQLKPLPQTLLNVLSNIFPKQVPCESGTPCILFSEPLPPMFQEPAVDDSLSMANWVQEIESVEQEIIQHIHVEPDSSQSVLSSSSSSSSLSYHPELFNIRQEPSQYVSWTPREEFILQTAISNWPEGTQISWSSIFSVHSHLFQVGRRPVDLSNKWKDMRLRTSEKIWPSISLAKREKNSSSSHIQEKRIRRRIDDLPTDEIWICERECGKRYKTSSWLSIHEHVNMCKGKGPRD
ncbi:MAG: hypothetical protein Sylvanvirus9_27 [Sylvanvirus sp.]|uniref:C2H2-type domain-containing protein n=1 Tax=Sylvanvirus sp. TaxID=2487774 RepID=A0A3G5AHW7_9VIRU|nr:MAG: hypothetical protein Sylvanvirus9_27 [Sylvanvirus sp.]